jgi:endonuclease/exonuclease/phosphatase (EEP) superfamily protein YafD
MVMPIAHRPARSAALRLAVMACALAIALAGCGRPAATSATPSPAGTTYTLMQMNLCLSGLADCYARVAYPAAVDEAAALIRETHPDAVTVSEACRGDVARIARRTGYHLRFSTVIYGGRPFGCVRPGGRGFFGDVNRVPSCAPAGFWTRTDASAGQGAGLQHVYGSGALHSPSARVVPFTHSDHDVLVVTSNLLR